VLELGISQLCEFNFSGLPHHLRPIKFNKYITPNVDFIVLIMCVANIMQDYKELFNENGLPKRCYPNHWKGGNRIYCAGFSKNGLQGIAYDAQEIANDINFTINAGKLPAAVEANAQIKF
jgi:hypothetical protein